MPTSHRSHLTVQRLEDREVPAGVDLLAVGADVGAAPIVHVYDARTQFQRFQIAAFDSSFTGGVRVAVADVNGDGIEDIVAAAGPGGGPAVKVFSGVDGSLLQSFFAYNPAFTGGVFVASGDTNNDGRADIITGAGAGGGPHVKVFSGADDSVLQSFFAFSPGFAGGVHVACGDVNGDGRADIISGAGVGGGPHVTVVSGATGKQLFSFFAYDQSFAGGVSVAAGDINGDGRADVITGAGPGGGPNVKVFSGLDNLTLDSFFAFSPTSTAGVRVGAGQLNLDNRSDIVASQAGIIREFDGQTMTNFRDFVAPGVNPFLGSAGSADCFATGCAPAANDTVLEADTVTLQAIRVTSLPPPKASRLMAMVSGAMYDAVNGIVGGHQAYLPNLPAAPANASADAAAAAAAHLILSREVPAQQALFDTMLQAELGVVTDGSARDAGAAYGRTVAEAMLSARAHDGSTTVTPFTPGNAMGDWQPTPTAFAPALLPNWANLQPFTMTSDTQFRPAGPPDISSAAFATAYNEVKDYGSATSSVRTADQTQIALFWADGAGTVTPPGHWNEIAQDVAQSRGNSLAENARLFALLNFALADAGIVAWNTKFTSVNGNGLFRPITAIREGDTIGNPAITGDPTWTPLITTPNFPSYTSGHSTFSSAAASVLTGLYGATPFISSSDTLPDVSRAFTSYQAAAQEAGQSRIYGGIHYQFDNVDGLVSGAALGKFVLANELK
ncbi:MAG: FG-GAP-like repeat-containing protein [Gemmataceae bacterium]